MHKTAKYSTYVNHGNESQTQNHLIPRVKGNRFCYLNGQNGYVSKWKVKFGLSEINLN